MKFIEELLALPNDSRKKTIGVAIILCLVGSVLVSATAVALRPMQEANKLLDKRRNILEIGGLIQADKSIDELFAQVETRIVELNSGDYVEVADAGNFDARQAAKDPAQSVRLKPVDDIASVKTVAKQMPVYLVKDGDAIKRVILPVHGYGLWSTLYGFLALEPDGRTVSGFGFYEHAETPGLGGEVDNPNWKILWQGKEVTDEAGNVLIQVIKGNVDPNSAEAIHQVDGLAGASLTSRGVQNLLHFWLGQQGFGPYLQKFRALEG